MFHINSIGILTHLYTILKYSSALAYLSSCSGGASRPIALNALFFQLVTIFHANLPFVKWSKVENLLASSIGGSNEVDDVIPKVRFLVTAAIADKG